MMFRASSFFIILTLCGQSFSKDKPGEYRSGRKIPVHPEKHATTPPLSKPRAVVDTPAVATNSKEPSASAEMGYIYPFEASDENSTSVMITRTEIDGGMLTISLREGEDYTHRAMGFRFPGVVDGTDPRYSDSDSAQVALLWKDKDGKLIGHTTNATPQSSRLGGNAISAQWKLVAGAKPTQLAWTTKIPEGAAQLEMVSIFTDTLMSPPSQTSRSAKGTARSGDLPLVISSFSGKLEANKWVLTPQPQNVEKARKFPQGQYPKVGDLPEHVAGVRQFLFDQTRFKLIRRPDSLEGVLSPLDKDSKSISDTIDRAIEQKKIQGINDTGFDIDPNSPLE